MKARTRSTVRLIALRSWAHRFSFAILLVAAIGLMMLTKIDTLVVEDVRARVTDAVSPVLNAVSRPAATVATVVEDVRQLSDLRAENARLEAENRALLQYQEIAFRLEAENLSLRALTNYRPDYRHRFLTARVIADGAGAFVRSLALNVGTADGIESGQAVLGGNGLAGRVVQAGERTARVLLITDFNARIPVLLERSRDRAMLVGDNTDRPHLTYLGEEASIAVGDRVVTSGHGGMFPPGLPVGTVVGLDDGLIRIQPFEQLDRLEFVRVVGFETVDETASMQRGLGGLSFEAMGAVGVEQAPDPAVIEALTRFISFGGTPAAAP
ncbi:MAG: rod shape-determining protein MreC [Pseudomonadota bacterium]